MAGEGGGIERYLRNIIKAFQKIDRKNEYAVFTNRDNTGTFDLRNNFREHYSPISAHLRPMKILWEQFVLPLQVKMVGIDLLFSPGNISPLFVPCPSVVVIHDLIPFRSPANFTKNELLPLKTLLCLTAKRATQIITVSKSSQKEILEQFNIPREKTIVVYEACDEKFLYHQPSAEDKNTVKEKLTIHGDFVLCTASTRQNKNLDRLLLAFSLLKRKHDIKHRLVIAGLAGPHHQSLIKMVSDLELGKEVVFTGHVSDELLPALYGAASVFVYPSLYEGFGLPVLEAMACNTPVVASNTTSLPEVVGDAGLLIEPYNVEDISEGIYKVLTDDELHRQLTNKGRKRVREFSWDSTARKTLSIMTSLTRTPS